MEIFRLWCGHFSFLFLSYNRNKIFPHQRQKFTHQRQTFSTPETKYFRTSLESFHFLSYPTKGTKNFHTRDEKLQQQNRKENILNGGLENVPKQLEKYSFPEKNIKSKIFFVITIIFTTPVNKFELMKHFQKTLYTFPQIQRNNFPF